MPIETHSPAPHRRSILVNPPFQIRMILIANFLALIVMGLIAFTVVAFVHGIQAHGIDSTHFLEERKRGLYAVLGFITFGTCSFVSFSTLLITHRVAGPIYRIKMQLDQMASGDCRKDVELRPKDFFQELAVACNRVSEAMRRLKSGEKNGEAA